MNGKIIADETITSLLEMADWAPTHGHTEPWRFIVFRHEALQDFCAAHAELYKQITPEERFLQATYEKLQKQGELASHLVIAYMKRGDNPKIPELEEICATACAIQNFLLAAQAQDLGVLWSTGGLTYNPALKTHLGLSETDQVLGLLYVGLTDEPKKQGRRTVPLAVKAVWK